MNDQQEWLDKLKATADQYRREVAEAERAVQAAQSRLAGAKRDLEIAENFLVMETARVTNESPLGKMPLGKAAASVVREKGTATIREIIAVLEARGFKLETNFPGRAIHASLLHASGIRKIAPATYEAEQGRLI